jgi:hypothetical protein
MARTKPLPPAGAPSEAALRQQLDKHQAQVQQLQTELLGEREYDLDVFLAETSSFMQHAAISMLEAGKRLLIIREHEGDNFWPVLRKKGIADADTRFVQKLIQAATKLCLGVPAQQQQRLAALGKSKMMELVVLDDDEIAELADGGSIADGVTLDKIDRMSTTELRKALRKTQEKLEQTKEITERQIGDKDAKINELDREVRRQRKLTVAEQAEAAAALEADLVNEVSGASQALLVEIQKYHNTITAALTQAPNDASAEQVRLSVAWLFQRINEVALQNHIPVDFAAIVQPDWVKSQQARTKR